jgi:hypothetical protein
MYSPMHNWLRDPQGKANGMTATADTCAFLAGSLLPLTHPVR